MQSWRRLSEGGGTASQFIRARLLRLVRPATALLAAEAVRPGLPRYAGYDGADLAVLLKQRLTAALELLVAVALHVLRLLGGDGEPVDERDGRDRVVTDGQALAPLLDAAVPRADVLADVAAVEPVADLRLQLVVDLAAVFDGQVADAAPRVELVGRREGPGRAGTEAGPALAAMIRLGSIEGKLDRKQKLAEEICLELSVHAMIEEEIFYPACEGKVEEADIAEAYADRLVEDFKGGGFRIGWDAGNGAGD